MRTLIRITFLLVVFKNYSQSDTTITTGEVVDAEILIEKESKIQFPVRQKINVNKPNRTFDSDPLNLTFDPQEPTLNWPDYKRSIGFRAVSDFQELGYQNYIKAGFGNFASPLLETGIYQSVGSFDINAFGFYESFNGGPVFDENSSSSLGKVDVSAAYKGNNFTITPSVGYQSVNYNFYGNTDRINSGFRSELPVESVFRDFSFATSLKGGGKRVSYWVQPKLISINQSVKDGERINDEDGFGIEGNFETVLDSSFTAGIQFSGYSTSYDGGLDYSRSLFKLSPWVEYQKDRLDLRAGFTVSSGEVGDFETESGFYPFAKVEWKLVNDWTVFGFFEGDIRWADLSTYLTENLFLDDSLILLNSELSSSFGGGIKGSPISGLSIEGGIRLDNLNNLPFYIPSSSDSSRFTLVYDNRTVNLLNIYGRTQYAINSDNLVGLELNIYDFTTKDLDRAWHQPNYSININTSHKIRDKVLFGTEWIAQGGIEAPAINSVGFIRLDAFLDINLRGSYLVTDRASVWFQVNNIAGNEYEKYIGYPVRGLSFKLGGKYRF